MPCPAILRPGNLGNCQGGRSTDFEATQPRFLMGCLCAIKVEMGPENRSCRCLAPVPPSLCTQAQ